MAKDGDSSRPGRQEYPIQNQRLRKKRLWPWSHPEPASQEPEGETSSAQYEPIVDEELEGEITSDQYEPIVDEELEGEIASDQIEQQSDDASAQNKEQAGRSTTESFSFNQKKRLWPQSHPKPTNQQSNQQSHSNPPAESDIPNKIRSYGQQLQYERNLHHLTLEELADKIGMDIVDILGWETGGSAPDFTARRKLSRILGNDFYLSSEGLISEVSPDYRAIQVRIVQRLPTGQSFTAVISALTELHARCWFIQQGRFARAFEYVQMHDKQFVEGDNLVITRLTSHSPVEMNFALLDPKNIAEALVIGIDGITQAKLRFQKAKLEQEKQRLVLQL